MLASSSGWRPLEGLLLGGMPHPHIKLLCAIATSWSHLFPRSAPGSSNSLHLGSKTGLEGSTDRKGWQAPFGVTFWQPPGTPDTPYMGQVWVSTH